jgi:hypothetical protein
VYGDIILFYLIVTTYVVRAMETLSLSLSASEQQIS